MPHRFKIDAVVMSLLVTVAAVCPSWAQTPEEETLTVSQDMIASRSIPCSAFKENLDGSWSALRVVAIVDGDTRMEISADRRISAGELLAGIDLTQALNEQCLDH